MDDKTMPIISNKVLKDIISKAEYYTYFKDRLYVYSKEAEAIIGYMLKEDFDEEKTLNTPDETAAEKFAVIKMNFKKGEKELFEEEDFQEIVIDELEVWLSYDSSFEE